MTAVTRLGLYGGPRSPYGSFEGKAEQPQPVITRARGGWLSPEQVAALNKLLKKQDKQSKRARKRKLEQAQKQLAELENIYDRIMGLVKEGEVTSEEAAPIREVVEEYSAPSDSPIPPVAAIDWQALVHNLNALDRLASSLLALNNLRQEEEDTLLLIMMMA